MASAGTIRVVISQKETTRKNTTPKNNVDSSMSIENLLENVAVHRAVSEISSQAVEMAMYALDRHLQLTDNYIGERYVKAGKEVIGKTISIGSSIAMAFFSGGVIGAALAAVVAIGSTAFDVFKNFDQQNIMVKQMNSQLEYQRQRAGYSLTSGSIGENK